MSDAFFKVLCNLKGIVRIVNKILQKACFFGKYCYKIDNRLLHYYKKYRRSLENG